MPSRRGETRSRDARLRRRVATRSLARGSRRRSEGRVTCRALLAIRLRPTSTLASRVLARARTRVGRVASPTVAVVGKLPVWNGYTFSTRGRPSVFARGRRGPARPDREECAARDAAFRATTPPRAEADRALASARAARPHDTEPAALSRRTTLRCLREFRPVGAIFFSLTRKREDANGVFFFVTSSRRGASDRKKWHSLTVPFRFLTAYVFIDAQ